ncbi:hypothetical protein QC761_309510 [Podospora bellae-mahoneyi]|uniref:Heterokaryon incompatibility domain-containing protein n=1 Tax=Podospora bellae-mahoneyi TaxID=2093777 RepID=A0ABR0FNR5_9PEZI|nr:hypothetical protein QC761_309510 [Podospora bellae-mahoneyi]
MPTPLGPSPQPQRAGYRKSGFAYTPLGLDPAEVRLLTLEPSEDDTAPIVCRVDIFEFDPDLYGHFDALSYAWGTKDDEQFITVNENTQFKIRKNLWLALRRIRHKTEPKKFWIDAICIDQGNPVEKSEQVGKIGDIYKYCGRCFIWLGDFPKPADVTATTPSSPASALELLNLFATLSQPTTHLSDLPCFTPFTKGKRADIKDSYKPHFESFAALLDLEWWKRTWTIQELALPSDITLLFADQELPYLTLQNAVDGLTRHSTAKCCKTHRLALRGLGFDTIVTIEERISSMVTTRQQKLEAKTPITFTQLRRKFCGSQVSWKRDSFYGFLGIVTNKNFLRPDYTLSLRQALTEAVFACVKGESDGVELLMGERLFRPQDGYRRLHVPSWVADASFCTFPPKWALMERRRLALYASFVDEGGEEKARKVFVKYLKMTKNGILLTKSRRVGVIGRVGEVLVDQGRWLDVPRVLSSWMELAGVKREGWGEDPGTNDERTDAFWRTMINDSTEIDGDRLLYGRPTTASEGGEQSDYSRLRSLWDLVNPAPKSPGPKSPAPATEGTTPQPQTEVGVDPFNIQPIIDEWVPTWVPGWISDFASDFIRAMALASNQDAVHDLVVSHDSKMIYHLLACLWERRLFVTENDDKIGLAPRDAQKGDEVHVIPGCPAPFILRRLDGPNVNTNWQLGDWESDALPQYMVVGNGFYHGFMGGDGGLGRGVAEEKIALH